jgi:hypothetical protein
MTILKASIGLLALIAIAGIDVAVAAPKKRMAYDQCFTDDGYGRRRPCSAGSVGFKKSAKAKKRAKKSKKRPPQATQTRAPKWGDPGYYVGWTPPPARAGGVGFKRKRPQKQ